MQTVQKPELMLRLFFDVTRMDRIINKHIRETEQVGQFGDKGTEAGLKWSGHVQRRDNEYIGRGMFTIELPGRRQRGRMKRRFVDVVTEEIQKVGGKMQRTERDGGGGFLEKPKLS